MKDFKQVTGYDDAGEPIIATDHTTCAFVSNAVLCATCLGEPISGKPCICGGIGTQAAELQGFRERAFDLENTLAEIREVWAGSECGVPVCAQEAYAIRLCKQMYQLAVDRLGI